MTISLERAWRLCDRLDETVNAAADRAMQAALWHTEPRAAEPVGGPVDDLKELLRSVRERKAPTGPTARMMEREGTR